MSYVCGECGLRYAEAGVCPSDAAQVTYEDDPLLGTQVGSYRLVRVIGQGGMGRVYAAIHPVLGGRVAIKVIADEHATNRELTQRFFAEARAVTMIRHESIVNVLDLLHLPDGRPVIVMELIEGQTLREIMHESLPPVGGVVAVMIDVLSALATAHGVGVVHRDLKPDNILVTPSGRGKVVDFGIAKLMTADPGRPALRTRTGVILGTPEYMAPEQISGGITDQRTDVYSAGVVLFEAVTGHRPFSGATDFDVMRQHVDLLPPSPRATRPDLPEQIEQVILCALAKRPSDRFGNATAMANALRGASATLSIEQRRALVPSSVAARSPKLRPPADTESPGIAVDDRAASYETVRATPGGRLHGATKPVAKPSRPSSVATRPDAVAEGPTVAAQRRSDVEMPYDITHPAAQRSALPAQRRRSPLVIPALALSGAAVVVAVVVAITTRSPAVRSAETPPTPDPVVVAQATAPVVAPPSDAPPVTPVVSPQIVTAASDAPPPANAKTPSTAPRTPPRVASTPSAPQKPTPAAVPLTTATVAVPALTPEAIGAMIADASYPLKGDPTRFDPNAYVTEAKRLARTMLPDAELHELELESVGSDGKVNLTFANTELKFGFVSPKQQKARRADLPANVGDMRKCTVDVVVTAAAVEVNMRPSEFCEKIYTAIGTPKCSIAELRKRAEAKGLDPKLVVTISTSARRGLEWTIDDETFASDDIKLRDDCGDIAPGQIVPDGAPKIAEKDGERRFVVPLALDRAKFDALAFAKTALALARKLQPDARLTEVELQPIKSDGRFPYYKRKDSNDDWNLRYMMYSDNAPVIDGKRACFLLVMVDDQLTEVEVVNYASTSCKPHKTFTPGCTLTAIWKKMIDEGADPDKPAWIQGSGNRWQFSGASKTDPRFFREFPVGCQ